MATPPENNETTEEDFSSSFEDTKTAEPLGEVSFVDGLSTHQRINGDFSGRIMELEKNHAKIHLITTHDMIVDELGLVHSGFIFSAADYTAAVAVNENNTVVIGSKVSFLAPAKVGDKVEFEGKVKFEDARKREVSVIGKVNDIKIFQGVFYVIALEKHIFKTKIKNVQRKY